jgi:hypothetical protein
MPVLTHLWEAGRLKWSAEAVALRPEFERLFTADERAVAKARLDAFNYNPADDWNEHDGRLGRRGVSRRSRRRKTASIAKNP